ncbi:MAG: tetratricopeptide repeat protein [Candidatus Heimdallarchaeota archaeon]
MSTYHDFIKDWNFSEPGETRQKFLVHLENARGAKAFDLAYEIQTQVARTFGLEYNFGEAHRILDEVEEALNQDISSKVRVRYYLERGRTFNSSKNVEKAMECFEKAVHFAKNFKEEFLEVDALHMMAIVEKDPLKQIEWNEKAIKVAENSIDEDTRNWLGPLLNNTGWSFHNLKDYTKALRLFEKALEFRRIQGNPVTIAIAMWCVARVHRSLNNIDKALELQLEVNRYRDHNKLEKGGYNYEELGELYLMKEDEGLAQEHFRLAYELLSQDKWLVNDEPERLDRIKKLGGL